MNTSAIASCSALLLSFTTLKAQVADAGSDQAVCGQIAVLQGNAPGAGQTGSWQSVVPGALFMDPFLENTPVGNLTFGPNDLVWTLTDGITSTADTVAIWGYDATMPFADAGPDQVLVAPLNYAYMSASPPFAPAFCAWTVLTGTCIIASPTDPNTVVTGFGVGWTTLQWSCDNGPCGVSTDQLVIQMMISTGMQGANSAERSMFAYDPVNRQLHLANAAPLDLVEVFDGQGRSVVRSMDGTRSLSMTDQPAGVYVARAILEDRTMVYRFVVGY